MARNDTGVLTVGKAVPSLVRWGVSADADLVYRYLVSFGLRPAGTIAADLGLAVRRVRAALDELDGCGVVQAVGVVGVDTMRWRASPVEAAVDKLRRRTPKPSAGPGPGRRADHPVTARRLPDRATTRHRIAELVTAERGEHLAMNPEQNFGVDALAIATPMDAELLRRRVRLRSLGRPPADGDRSARRAEEFVRLGGEYREADRLPYKLMIFDRRVALMAVDPLNLDGGTWEVDEPAVVAALVTLFVRHWSGATDPRRKGVPTVVLTQRERAVVALLAEGHTDATAAKRLGMSQRSVTYLLRGVMDRFGVENRFQLGLALGATHTIAPPIRAAGQTADETADDETAADTADEENER